MEAGIDFEAHSETIDKIEREKDLHLKLYKQTRQMLAVLAKDIRGIKADMAVNTDDILTIKRADKISPEKLKKSMKMMEEIMNMSHVGGERPKEK